MWGEFIRGGIGWVEIIEKTLCEVGWGQVEIFMVKSGPAKHPPRRPNAIPKF